MYFDPCITILANTKNLSDDQMVAAMGGNDVAQVEVQGRELPGAIYHQVAGKEDIKVHWTPIFALGKVRVYFCDPPAAARDETPPVRLNESREIGKLIQCRVSWRKCARNTSGPVPLAPSCTTTPRTWWPLDLSDFPRRLRLHSALRS